MTDLLKHIFRCCVFIFVQLVLLTEVPPLHRYVSPNLYYLFLLWLPFRLSRISLLLIAFFYGLTLDAFMHTPGLHAAACTLMAYVRPFFISILLPKEAGETGYPEPSYKSMGIIPYGTYIMLLTVVHHLYLTLLEWLPVSYPLLPPPTTFRL